MNKKVICALSGGVDSSVAAALLKRAGFDVVGVFMKLVDLPSFRESEKKARKVTSVLKIPFLSFDLRKEFRKKVIDYFLKEYEAGRTPNPCVVCNKEIKFGLLLEKALVLGADFVATGHYANTNLNNYIRQKNAMAMVRRLKEIKLFKGKDREKDQSYFLWKLNQEILRKVLFPIGEYTKAKVRGLAKKFKLPVLNIPESQEICFIKNTNINEYLKTRIFTNTGKIVNTEKKVIGQHQGLWFYTIGQRRGLGLAGGPCYVLDKDFKKNILIVTQNEKDLYKKELIAKNVNWISGKEPELPLKIKAKIRYRQKAAEGILNYNRNFKVYSLKFKVTQRAITPGQSVVFYSPAEVLTKAGKGYELLGGGIIC